MAFSFSKMLSDLGSWISHPADPPLTLDQRREHADFLAAIHAAPLDDAPRLIYADWLDEQGGAGRIAHAEFIRLQCELHGTGLDDAPWNRQREKRERKQRSRMWQLQNEWGSRWAETMPPCSMFIGRNWARGFPESLNLWEPIRNDRTIAKLAHVCWPCITSLTTPFEARLFTRLNAPAASHLEHLGWLHIHNGIRTAKPEQLARAFRLPALQLLAISGSYSARDLLPAISMESFDALLEALAAARLTRLAITGNGLTPEHVARLVRSPVVAGLTSLDLRYNPLGDEGAQVLAEAPSLANLTELRLPDTEIGCEGERALRESPHLRRDIRIEVRRYFHDSEEDQAPGFGLDDDEIAIEETAESLRRQRAEAEAARAYRAEKEVGKRTIRYNAR